MHPSTAQAEVLVDELVRNDVRHVVLSPGSRNAPLSFALFQAAQDERLQLHVRVDERSAGFLALGIGKQIGVPAAVVCTSGTAAANLHPAVSEAHQSGVPLLVLTADRPPELRAARANQTIEQDHLYGGEVRLFDELAVAQEREGQSAYWRSQVCRACQAARGGSSGGPVHLNLPFREPLVPSGDDQWCESLAGRPGGLRWTSVADRGQPSALSSVWSRRGLVLVADGAEAAGEWGERHGWPVLAESGGVGLSGAAAIGTGMWLLGLPEFLREHRPEQVVCVGRPTVFRQVQGLLADSSVEVLLVHGEEGGWPAPAHDVREVAETFGAPEKTADPSWLTAWQQADQKAAAGLADALDLQRWPNGPALARDLVDALPAGALLTVGSSNPTRDVALAARSRPDIVLRRNRGAAGIDGTVSTAAGAALARGGPAYALVGDLTFLHDANGLLVGPHERRPDLTIVVFNDDGGGIFSLLEQGGPEHADAFDRIFGAPHGADLGHLCAAHGVPHVLVRERAELARELRWQPGFRVIEVRGTRANLRDTHADLREAVRAAVLG